MTLKISVHIQDLSSFHGHAERKTICPLIGFYNFLLKIVIIFWVNYVFSSLDSHDHIILHPFLRFS